MLLSLVSFNGVDGLKVMRSEGTLERKPNCILVDSFMLKPVK